MDETSQRFQSRIDDDIRLREAQSLEVSQLLNDGED